MVIKPSPTVNGMTLWIADGHSEEELKNGLSLGYIEWKGVKLLIDKVQEWNPTAPGLVTKLVHVKTSKEILEKLNAIMVADIKAGRN